MAYEIFISYLREDEKLCDELVAILEEDLEYEGKVFVDGFLSSHSASHVLVPKVPLAELYGQVHEWLVRRGVTIHTSALIEQLAVTDGSERPSRTVTDASQNPS